MKSAPVVWITKTTRDGDTNARIGIAERINKAYSVLKLPSEFCAIEQAKSHMVTAGLISAENPKWPAVLIGPCFHIPFMQLVKTMSGGKTVIVALRPPVRGLPIKADREDIGKTDIIVSYPYHDNSFLPNVMLCNTVSNRVSQEKLNDEKEKWQPSFSVLSQNRPVIGVLVGGDIGHERKVFPLETAKILGERINRFAEEVGGFLFISTSARTSPECKKAVCSNLTVPNHVFDPKVSTGENPYFGILACAEFLIVTADSMSMCSEAVSTQKPTYILYDERIVEGTHASAVAYLIESKSARFLEADTKVKKFPYCHQNSAENIAQKVHWILGERKS